ncbi:MAG: conserved exported protein of unknown function [Promethearchaeota archaeon]|nr:MAG: conserved exported protein of unknown function [Candidatus Lokiarchaeota archaeon]
MKLNKKHIACAIILFSIFTGFLLCQPNTIDKSSYHSEKIKISQKTTISAENIYVNDTVVTALFDQVFIEINTTELSYANYSKVKFQYPGGSSDVFDMEHKTGENFTYTYTPPYYVPNGTTMITFQVYNESGVLINTDPVQTELFIYSNYYAADFPPNYDNEGYLNETLNVKILIDNISAYEPQRNFSYQVSIVNSTDPSLQTTIKYIPGDDIEGFSLFLNESLFTQVNKHYYVKVNLTDEGSGRTEPTYFRFKVLNYNPEILESTLSIPDEIYRTIDFDISINVSDIESAIQDINVSAQLTTPLGQKLGQVEESENPDNNFTLTLNVAKNRPIGQYLLNITAIDPDGGLSSFIHYITILNLSPEIKNFWINGLSPAQQISIFYGDDITFTFDVSDEDSDIEYVTVSLLNENDEWFNTTKLYTPANFEIAIRSIDLVRGTWNVYISVTDSDDSTTSLTSDIGQAPKQIRIVPDALGLIMPWITLIVGLIIGLLMGIALAYKLIKRKPSTQPAKQKPSKKAPSKPQEKAPTQPEEKPKEKMEKPTQKKIKRRL